MEIYRKEAITIAKKPQTINYQSQINELIKEKYPYLILGLTVILIAYLVISGLVSKKIVTLTQNNNKATSTTSQESNKTGQKQYVVKDGDDLWHIAEATYGSGYNAYDIAQANKIADPNIISAGDILVLPSVAPKQPTTGEVVASTTTKVTITSTTYTVKSGDYLWKIAQEAYGDGYAWTKIAEANHLTDPGLIFSGNILTLPR